MKDKLSWITDLDGKEKYLFVGPKIGQIVWLERSEGVLRGLRESSSRTGQIRPLQLSHALIHNNKQFKGIGQVA